MKKYNIFTWTMSRKSYWIITILCIFAGGGFMKFSTDMPSFIGGVLGYMIAVGFFYFLFYIVRGMFGKSSKRKIE